MNLPDVRENLLCIVPPYRHRNCPPAGAAALLGHLAKAGQAFSFLDLRLLAPDVLAPTYHPVGPFGESFVIDVPDLPIVLSIIAAYENGHALLEGLDADWFARFCLERGLLPRRLRRYLSDVDQLVEDGISGFPDLKFVGFSVWTSNFATTLVAAARLKRRKRPPFIVAGGPQVTESRSSALLALRSGLFDAVILGEGEDALADVFEAWSRGEPRKGIAGVLHRMPDGTVLEGPERKLLRLTTLAQPGFDAMSLADYRNEDGRLKLPFQLSRGCTDKCTFCSEWVFWKHFRLDTSEHAADQLLELSQRYRVYDFHFTDSLINGHMRRLTAFAEALVSRSPQVSWGGFMRADMDTATARLLRRAGLAYVYVGVESFSDETLKLMNKRRTEADNIRSIRAFLATGLPVSVGIIPGFPGDTRERFQKTVSILLDLADEYPRQFSFNVEPFILSPGQPLYRQLEDVGLSAVPWSEEVLEMAPGYRDITAGIACRAEGSNQGIERSGQLALLRIVSGATALTGDDLAVDRVTFLRVEGLTLCQVKHRGRIHGALLTAEERTICAAIVEGGERGRSPLDDAEFSAFWEATLSRHQLRPTLKIVADGTAFGDRAARWLQIPGHIAARQGPMIENGCPMLVVVNTLTGAALSMPIALGESLEWLAGSPRSCQLVLENFATPGLSTAEARTWLDALAEAGIVRPT